ncbi:MAG TPA: hypothetical protein VGM67_04145 [Gemmatimonadaceae bacterium]|jgi:hypothetical protein
MRKLRMVMGLFALSATVGSLGACSHSNTEYGEVAPANAIVVHIQNQNFLDMDIYAVAAGVPTRLGTVTGNSSGTFVVNASMTHQDFAIDARPIGGNGRASTGNISVGPGQTIEFRIGSVMSNSSVFIRG